MSTTDHIDASQQRPKRRVERLSSERSEQRRTRRLVVIGVAAAVIVAACGVWLFSQNRGLDRVAAGVKVAGVPVGGMTQAQARAALRSWLRTSGVAQVALTTRKGVKQLVLDRLGIGVDVPATVRLAMAKGRHEVAGVVVWRGSGGDVRPVVRVKPHLYERGLAVIRDEVNRPARNASLRLRDKRIVVVPDKTGLAVDDIRLERTLLRSLASGRSYRGEIPTTIVMPEVSTFEAQSRLPAASVYLARPLTLALGQHRLKLRPAVMAKMLAASTSADSGAQPLTFDNKAARKKLRHMFRKETTPARNATVEVKHGKVYITSSQEGRGVDMARLTADMDAAAAGNGLRTVHVNLIAVHPRFTTAQLQAMGLSALGSQFTTYYSPRNKARAANIALAARIVNGTIIPPGKTFSLNETLGPRTENRGFDVAPVIVDGVLRQGVGGGICQYATTLFNAVFFAGLPIVERHPHTFAISHYPLGRDASVAWGSQDFRFRNTTGQPLMIRSFTTRGTLTVVIIGRTGRTVSYVTGRMRDIHRPHGSESHPRIVYDSDQAGGLITLEQGNTGYTITVVRTVRANEKVLFRDRFVSRYAARDWVRRIGTRH